jgi:hypothetical protein
VTQELRTENREENTFTDRTRAIVIALASLSLVASIAVLVFGRDLAPPPAQPRDSYGRGPLGHRAWAETLQALGVHVVRWTRSSYEDVSAPLFIIEPDHATYDAPDGRTVSIADLCTARSAAGRLTVLVLPKWHIGALGNVAPDDAWRVREVLAGTPFEGAQLVWQSRLTSDRDEITASSAVFGERHLEIPWPQTVIGPTPLLSGPTGSFIAADPSGRTFLVSDPDLLHNFDVQRADHAAIAHEFVTEVLQTDTIVVDEVFHEHVETRSLAQIFSHFPGVLALLHGGLVVLVVLLYGRRRFGPPRVDPAPYGRGPREVIDVAAGVLASGQSVERLAPRYVEQVILDAHRRLGLAEGKSLAQKAAALDATLTRRGLLPDAVRLLETSQSATRETALALATRATQLRESLLGATKKTAPRARPVSIPPPPPTSPLAPAADRPEPPPPT